jgi:uncharacterized phage-associated protein
MATASRIAKYIVKEALKRKMPVTNLKLQKLLYFVQGVHLFMHEKVAFLDEIIAWQYGPVVKDVYYEYSIYGANDIIPIDKNEKIILSMRLKKLVSFVLDDLLRYSDIALVKETKKEGSPWSQVSLNEVIDEKDIYEYFLKNYIHFK